MTVPSPEGCVPDMHNAQPTGVGDGQMLALVINEHPEVLSALNAESVRGMLGATRSSMFSDIPVGGKRGQRRLRGGGNT